jgi:hypothetical protein
MHHLRRGRRHYFLLQGSGREQAVGSNRIRRETIDYFLRRYREEIIRKRKAGQEIEAQLALLEAELRSRKPEVLPTPMERLEPQTQGMAAD